MNITISQGNHAFNVKSDATIIIDVLRAGTTAHYLSQYAIKSCTLVPDKATAFSLKDRATLLVGEEQGIKIEGFDFGNSPYRILDQDAKFNNKKVVFLTSNGTKALLNNFQPNGTFLCGLVNAATTVEYLKQQSLPSIHIIASHPVSDDDLVCAEYMQALFNDEAYDKKAIINRIQLSKSAFKFHRQPDLFPLEDLELACREDQKAKYVLKAQQVEGFIRLNQITY